MKLLFLSCLLAGCQIAFAQTLSFTQLTQLIQTKEAGIKPQLSSRGYVLSSPLLIADENILYPVADWKFSPADASLLSRVMLWQDSSSTCYRLRFETSNPYLFTQMLTEMQGSGFSLSAFLPGKDNMKIEFESKKVQLKVIILQQPDDKKYQLEIQSIPAFASNKNNHI
ncbi:MAG: hypothetical protein QM781_12770 [Chitinophagaceae bacterium]